MSRIVNAADLGEAIIRKEEDLRKKVYLDDDAIVIDVEYEYRIPLAECRDAAAILHWAYHLTEKTWMDTEVLGRFIAVAVHHSGIQISL